MQNAPSPLEAVVALESDAEAVAVALQTILRPSDVTEVIGALQRTQEALAGVYASLASWHRSVELGVHHGGDEHGGLENPGWVRADIALEEASQYARDGFAALERARKANMSARWFDEIRADEG
jgi:hypothetical protein